MKKPLTRTVPGTTEDILSYVASHGIHDKDVAFPTAAPAKKKDIEKRKGGVLRMTLDLHGLTGEEAGRRLRTAVEECRERGVKELLVIHGKGHHSSLNEGPVLKTVVRALIENELRLRVRDFRTALPRDGGDGATVVLLA